MRDDELGRQKVAIQELWHANTLSEAQPTEISITKHGKEQVFLHHDASDRWQGRSRSRGVYANNLCKSLEYRIYSNPQTSLVLRTQGRVLISVARFPPKNSGPSNVGRGFGMTASGALSMSTSGNMHAFLCVCVCLQDASARAVRMFVKCWRS